MSLRRFGVPLPHSRGTLLFVKMPPTAEHVVDEQRDDDEQVGDARSVSSERERQREEHGIGEKKFVTLQPHQQPIVIVSHEHHDDCDDDDLPTLCEHYRGKATVGRVRGEHRRVPPARRRRLLPGPRPPSRVLYSQPFSPGCLHLG